MKLLLSHLIVLELSLFPLTSSARGSSSGHGAEHDNCLGAPFLYLTVDNNPGVLKYSRNGCRLSDDALVGHPGTELLRSVVVGPYKSIANALYVADAGQTDDKKSKLMVFGDCAADGTRPYLETAVDQRDLNEGMHAYGLALDENNNLYSSFQRAQSVFRFTADRFSPMPLPEALQTVHPTPSPGSFYRFTYSSASEGVRAITFVGMNLWIANEHADGIIVVDSSGYQIRKVYIRHPIGVHFDSDLHLVFVSSKSSYGVVYAISPDTYATEHRYHCSGMTHPSGITSYQGTLFVLRHQKGTVETFDIESEKYLGAIVSGFADNSLEQVTLSNC